MGMRESLNAFLRPNQVRHVLTATCATSLVVGSVVVVAAMPAIATSWTVIEAPLPANTAADPSPTYVSVACASSAACAAVGDYFDTSSTSRGLIDTLSGGAWSATEVPLPANANTSHAATPNQVVCPSAGACTAVGSYLDNSTPSGQSRAFIDTLSGGIWSATEAPLPANTSTTPAAVLNSVACNSSGACTAVGTYDDALGNTQGLIDILSGGVWTPTEAQLPVNAALTGQVASLDSVACAAAGACTVVGSYTDTSTDTQGLIDTLSGGVWTPGEAALPSNAAADPSVSFTSVACPSTGACAAIGDYLDSVAHDHNLIETLSGGTWSDIEAPLPANAAADPHPVVSGLACDAAGSCTAVGDYIDNSSPMGFQQGVIDTLSGGTWSAVQAPLPSNHAVPTGFPFAHPFNSLTTVTCPSAGTCTAVGLYADNQTPTGEDQPLVDALSGGIWSPVEAPLPANATSSSQASILDAVACASATVCAAVGEYDTSGSRQGLIESIGISSPPPSCPGGFAITTASPLPSATHGDPYTLSLSGCGGTPPYKFKKIGKLPKGLKLSHTGVISGTPAKAGSATFNVKVTDKAKPKHTVTQTFSLTVN